MSNIRSIDAVTECSALMRFLERDRGLRPVDAVKVLAMAIALIAASPQAIEEVVPFLRIMFAELNPGGRDDGPLQ
jgi:hypothetical protein